MKGKLIVLLIYDIYVHVIIILFVNFKYCLYCFRRRRDYHVPLDDSSLDTLTKKNFSPETLKKVSWVRNMYNEWRDHRNSTVGVSDIHCDLDNMSTVSVESFIFAMCRFITEVKKLDGSEFPPKTLYDIVICVQFYLKTQGLMWKILSDDTFKDLRFTLDNVMKERTARGIGILVKKAQVLTKTDEDVLWRMGFLGTHSPEALLYSVMFTVGLSCSLRGGKEHHALRSIPFNSQFSFLYDDNGKMYFKYVEDIGMKTNKGGIKHRKLDAKVVDVCQIDNVECCPVHILHTYMEMLPKNRKSKSLYLHPRKKFSPGNWYRDTPVGENKLKTFVKDLCEKAGIPGRFTNHSLRATGTTRMYHDGIDEQVICEITGHRSLAVCSYKCTCDKQRQEATKSIFGESH